MKISNCEQHALGMASQWAEPNRKESHRCPWLSSQAIWPITHLVPASSCQEPGSYPAETHRNLAALTHHCSARHKETKAVLRSWEAWLTFALLSWMSWSWFLAGGLPLLCTLGMTYHHQREGERRKDEQAQMSFSKLGVMVHTHNPSTCEAVNDTVSSRLAWETQCFKRKQKVWMPLIQHSKGGGIRIYLSKLQANQDYIQCVCVCLGVGGDVPFSSHLPD